MEDAITREEVYLQVLSGVREGPVPEPLTREEYYLCYLCENYGLGKITQEQVDEAVQKYLENNNVTLNISGGTFADWGE